jgi:hypothetical protein
MNKPNTSSSIDTTTRLRCIVRRHATLTALFFVALTGCERESMDNQVESVPAAEAETEAPEGAADTEAKQPATPDLPWTVPDGWTEDPAPRQMRLATYIATDTTGPVEVAVTRFSGRVGGDLANINRWRGQMGLTPISEADLSQAIVRFTAPGYDGYEARIESPSGVMLAAGVYDESIDQMWFVRATLPDTEVADRIETDLFGMARSIAGLKK